VIFAAVLDEVSIQLASHHIHNIIGLHFYTMVEFFILSGFFVNVFNQKRMVSAVKVMGILFTILCLVNVAFFQKVTQFNTYTRSLEALLIVVYCLIYFDQESKLKQTVQWQNRPNNWFVTSNLQYFACAFFLFLFSNVIGAMVKPATFSRIWDIHTCLVMAMYLLFATGFWYERSSR
jgi:hypothetical protein